MASSSSGEEEGDADPSASALAAAGMASQPLPPWPGAHVLLPF